MKYKASRDIPLAIQEKKSLSPTEIQGWVASHRTRKDPKTKKRVQVVPTISSISHWITRNSKIVEPLRTQIEKPEAHGEKALSETLLTTKAFFKIPIIAKMRDIIISKGSLPKSANWQANCIRRACLGLAFTKGSDQTNQYIENWGLKHPADLTLDDCIKYIAAQKKLGKKDTRITTTSFRNLFRALGRADWVALVPTTPNVLGKFAHIYVKREVISQIFNEVKALNKTAFQVAFFAFKTASRRGAIERARYENIDPDTREIDLIEKRFRGKDPTRVTKIIPTHLWEVLELDNNTKTGAIFDIDRDALYAILRSAYKKYIKNPEVLAYALDHPLHFWRHQFAQHMLRATNWNYTLVAYLGKWRVSTLEDYYGKPVGIELKKAGFNELPNI